MPHIRIVMLSMALALVPGLACGQGRLEARYGASLAGITIGRGAWVVDIAENQYSAEASGMTAGLLRVFTSGEGTAVARGAVVAGNLMPASYVAKITTDKKLEELRLDLAGGDVKAFSIDPPAPPPGPDRIPISDAHLRGVVDPMTASLVRVSGSGDPAVPEACARNVAIFDGRMRYDLRLAFKRMEQVRLEKGYQGPVVICAVYFAPIAGYVPERPAIRYLVAQRDMEVWLAPVAGTRVLVPFRMAIPTPLGLGALQAMQFALLPRATPTRLGQ